MSERRNEWGPRRSSRKRIPRFKSKEKYRRFLAYGHMRTKSGGRATGGRRKSVFEATPGHIPYVYIRGKKHYPQHTPP